MKFPALSGKFTFLVYDSYTKMEPNMPAIVTRSGLYSASLLAVMFAGYYGLQGKREVAGGLGTGAVVFYLSARYAPLPLAQVVSAVALTALFAVPIVGLASHAWKNS